MPGQAQGPVAAAHPEAAVAPRASVAPREVARAPEVAAATRASVAPRASAARLRDQPVRSGRSVRRPVGVGRVHATLREAHQQRFLAADLLVLHGVPEVLEVADVGVLGVARGGVHGGSRRQRIRTREVRDAVRRCGQRSGGGIAGDRYRRHRRHRPRLRCRSGRIGQRGCGCGGRIGRGCGDRLGAGAAIGSAGGAAIGSARGCGDRLGRGCGDRLGRGCGDRLGRRRRWGQERKHRCGHGGGRWRRNGNGRLGLRRRRTHQQRGDRAKARRGHRQYLRLDVNPHRCPPFRILARNRSTGCFSLTTGIVTPAPAVTKRSITSGSRNTFYFGVSATGLSRVQLWCSNGLPALDNVI